MNKDRHIDNLKILKTETEEHLKDLQALENKIDELKFARDTTSKMSDDEIAERLSKVVEPYVRSEE